MKNPRSKTVLKYIRLYKKYNFRTKWIVEALPRAISLYFANISLDAKCNSEPWSMVGSWYLYKMVAQTMLRTYDVKKVFFEKCIFRILIILTSTLLEYFLVNLMSSNLYPFFSRVGSGSGSIPSGSWSADSYRIDMDPALELD